MTRRARANALIRAALTPPPATRLEAERLLREAYPWGERAAHPYKAWLQARRDVLAELYGPKVLHRETICTNLFAAASRGQEGEE